MKKLTAFCLFCLCFLFAKADTFTVTSNADSGPGTLREAITLANANGMAIADQIHFNLTDQSTAGRTIMLLSALPLLTSNLVVDGTTQSGSKFGISDAKIILERSTSSATYFSGLSAISAANIEIYGLYIRYFLTNPATPSIAVGGIELGDVQNIQIGNVGKGNVISANGHGIYHHYRRATSFEPLRQGVNIVIKSNILGLNPDGETMTAIKQGMGIWIWEGKNIQVGGDGLGEGNILTGNRSGGFAFHSQLYTGNGFIRIIKNKLGFDYTGLKVLLPIGYPDGINSIVAGASNSMDYDVEIRQNQFSGFFTALNIWEVTRPFRVVGNEIGVIKPAGLNFSNQNGIYVDGCATGIIGGDGADKNIVAYSKSKGIFSSDGNTGSSLITVTKNSIYCNEVKGISVEHLSYRPHPWVYINNVTGSTVKGKAKPGSTVEVFYDDSCVNCEGKIYIGSATAGADSSWQYSGPITGNVVATSTEPSGLTSEFSKAEANLDRFQIKHASCERNNGAVTGIQIKSGTHWYWQNASGAIVSYDTALLNVPAGNYQLVVSVGSNACKTVYGPFQIKDLRLPPTLSNVQVQNANCGNANGKLSVMDPLNGIRVKWMNAAGDSIGNSAVIDQLLPGQYSLQLVMMSDETCFKNFGPYLVQNQSGPSLNTNVLQITPAVCGTNTGSITGILANNTTGAVQIRWIDSSNNVVGTGFDLINVPSGKYRLKFKDGSSCDTITSPFYHIGNTGEITINTATAQIKPAKCSGNTGGIQNIAVSGGADYEWTNTNTGAIVGNTLAIGGLPAGSYQLTVTNSLGCTKTAPVLIVPQTTFLSITVQASGSIAARCGQPNGSIAAQTFSRDTGIYRFYWKDSATNQVVGNYTRLVNIFGGTYLLFAVDSNGCESQILKRAISNLPVPYFDYNKMQVSMDECLSGKGAISGIIVKDMRGGSGNYVWYNSQNDSIGNTLNMQNLPEGVYNVKATDLIGCTVVSQPITIGNRIVPLPSPQVDDQIILKGTTASLQVKNFRSGRYELFDDITSIAPIQTNTTGSFTTPVLVADKIYHLRYVSGICSSNHVPVKITVVDRTGIYVPTAFTPNNDGKNDRLRIVAYGRVKLHNFTVFNRWGEAVYTSADFSEGWDGSLRGTPAVAGVYVWVLKATDELTGKTIEQKGTITIIR